MTENQWNRAKRAEQKRQGLGSDGKPLPGRPRRKATDKEVQERIEVVANWLVKEKTRCEIHKLFERKYHIRWYTCDGLYIPRAKDWLVERCAITAAQAKSKGLNVLVDVLRTGTNGERLKAERRLAEVFGYDAPKRMEVTGRDGEPLVNERAMRAMPTEELVKMAQGDDGSNG